MYHLKKRAGVGDELFNKKIKNAKLRVMTNLPEHEIRLQKLQTLRDKGIDPYPSIVPPFKEITEAKESKEGDQIAVAGRISALRDHGKATFIDLSSEEKLQTLAKADDLGDLYDLIPLLDIGDYIWVKGEMFTTKTGQLTLGIKELQLLSKSILPVPEHFHGLTDIETRYRQRSLDFKINKEARDVIRVRSDIIAQLRAYLEKNGFIEIQTPILQAIPGGAAAKPFVTKYNILDADFYLRIAPELYLKRLISGGFERVFEIGPAFRNEGISHMHNPEFTICEFYWAYKTYQDLMVFTKDMVQSIIRAICGDNLKLTYQGKEIDFSGEWKSVQFGDLIKEETGIDIYDKTDFKELKKVVQDAGIELNWKEINVWGKLVDELYKKVSRPEIVQPTFITDHPAELTPLAKRNPKNPLLAQRFQLVAAGGFELVNAYTELNDPLEQERLFKEQAGMRDNGFEEGHMVDKNYIEALSFGMPPTAGWGMGIDRFTMILTDQYSIKEVIPFPTLKPEK